MFARVTLFELDTLRMPLNEAVDHFNATVLPALRTQPGFAGVYVLSTPEGKGLLMSLWESEAAAASSLSSGFYDAQVAEFLMLLREPPGREHYEVISAEVPVAAPA
jgi:heme-degrading monooxygenase HmoA